MKSKLFWLLFILVSAPAFAQKQEPRKLLLGRVVADSVQVDNVTIKNVTSNILAVTDIKGDFTIYARPTDTLYFWSVVFRDVMLILKKQHFEADRLVIPLDVNVTVLDEVKISQLTGNLEKDSRLVKSKNLTPQFNSAAIVAGKIDEYKYSEETTAGMPPVGKNMHGLNFVGLYNLIFKKKKGKPVTNPYAHLNFSEELKSRYTYYFFTETLKIPKDEIGLFLNYCDDGPGMTAMLAPSREFELTDYLVTKSIEYRKLKN